MRVLFVRPKPTSETIGLQHVMLVEPLELEVLASLVGRDDAPVIVDMVLEKRDIGYFINREQPDVLCVTGYITNIPTMISYCAIAKAINPAIVTIVGGVHCEVCPDDLDNEFVDFRVVRNATTVLPKLLDYVRGRGEVPIGVLRAGQLHVAPKLPPFDFYFPYPRRELTNQYREHYFYIFHDRVALIKTAFGCPYSCSFCFCRMITGGKYHERPLDNVLTELRSIREQNVYIVDDDFLVSKQRVEAFIQANRALKLKKQYLLYGRADFIASNPNVIGDFRDIGLRTVIVGFESFFSEELKQYNKKVDIKENEAAIAVLNHYGVDCFATIIVSPEWGLNEFELCRKRLLDLGIHYVNLQPLTPLPGTAMRALDDDLLISYSDYEKWDLAHVSIRPKKISVADFYTSIIRLYGAILFQPKYLIEYLLHYNFRMVWEDVER